MDKKENDSCAEMKGSHVTLPTTRYLPVCRLQDRHGNHDDVMSLLSTFGIIYCYCDPHVIFQIFSFNLFGSVHCLYRTLAVWLASFQQLVELEYIHLNFKDVSNGVVCQKATHISAIVYLQGCQMSVPRAVFGG